MSKITMREMNQAQALSMALEDVVKSFAPFLLEMRSLPATEPGTIAVILSQRAAIIDHLLTDATNGASALTIMVTREAIEGQRDDGGDR